MRTSNFTTGQKLAIVYERASGKSVAQICHAHNISKSTFYAWCRHTASLPHGQVPMQLVDYKRVAAEQAASIRKLRMQLDARRRNG